MYGIPIPYLGLGGGLVERTTRLRLALLLPVRRPCALLDIAVPQVEVHLPRDLCRCRHSCCFHHLLCLPATITPLSCHSPFDHLPPFTHNPRITWPPDLDGFICLAPLSSPPSYGELHLTATERDSSHLWPAWPTAARRTPATRSNSSSHSTSSPRQMPNMSLPCPRP